MKIVFDGMREQREEADVWVNCWWEESAHTGRWLYIRIATRRPKLIYQLSTKERCKVKVARLNEHDQLIEDVWNFYIASADGRGRLYGRRAWIQVPADDPRCRCIEEVIADDILEGQLSREDKAFLREMFETVYNHPCGCLDKAIEVIMSKIALTHGI
jgi:hypothetical protein